MNKAQLLAALDTKFDRVLRVEQVDTLEGVSWYTANVLNVEGDLATRGNVSFYVVDEGTANEVAYWHASEPKPDHVPTFQGDLITWLDTLVADGTILFYNVIGVLPEVERARVDVVLEQDSNYVERPVGVHRDAQGTFHYVLITTG